MELVNIIKIGGKIVDNHQNLIRFLADFNKINSHKILVHGGGNIATKYSELLNIKSIMVEGRRVTNKKTLDLITMVYAGLVNKNIVAQLQSINCDAVGLSGADGNLISARKRKVENIDYGFVGDITPENIKIDFFNQLFKIGKTPVICSLVHNKKGNLLNVNADTIAATIAMAFAKKSIVKLTYCFDQQGIMTKANGKRKVLGKITPDIFLKFKKRGVIKNGMVAKLENAFKALNNRVKYITIKHPEDLLTEKNGTKVSL